MTCDSCHSSNLAPRQLCRRPVDLAAVSSDSMRVTNKDYGLCLEMVRCADCGLVQPKYLLAFSDIVKLYASMEDEQYLDSSYLRGVSNYRQIIKDLRSRLPQTARVLEIGSGSGALVHLLRQDFPATEGLEPSRFFCGYAKKKYGVDIMNISVEDLETNGQYDAVVALDVIEHVTSPNRFMTTVVRALKPGGLAIIVTPNLDSVTARVMGQKWWHIRPPHLYYFGDRSFGVLAAKHGFKVVSKRFFTWNLPFSYLANSVQKLVFGRAVVSFKLLKFNVVINTLDSRIYTLENLSTKKI